MARPTTETRGEILLRELRDEIPPARVRAILRDFASLAGDDRSSSRLRAATGGELDLGVARHRTALLAWLRAWGCRHLRVADTARSSRVLAAWWRRHRGSLPAAERWIVDLPDRELDAAAGAYAALATAPAAWRAHGEGRASVSFGETAASKALFALRPLALPPWDAPMRAAFGSGDGRGPGYRSYLEQTAIALRGVGRRLGVPVGELPTAFGRSDSTPPKLVDEYLWMRLRAEGRIPVAGSIRVSASADSGCAPAPDARPRARVAADGDPGAGVVG